MRQTISSVLCIARMIALGVTVDAARRTQIKKREFTPPPTATPPPAPSVDLSRFIGANLDKIWGRWSKKRRCRVPNSHSSELHSPRASAKRRWQTVSSFKPQLPCVTRLRKRWMNGQGDVESSCQRLAAACATAPPKYCAIAARECAAESQSAVTPTQGRL